MYHRFALLPYAAMWSVSPTLTRLLQQPWPVTFITITSWVDNWWLLSFSSEVQTCDALTVHRETVCERSFFPVGPNLHHHKASHTLGHFTLLYRAAGFTKTMWNSFLLCSFWKTKDQQLIVLFKLILLEKKKRISKTDISRTDWEYSISQMVQESLTQPCKGLGQGTLDVSA